MPKGKIADSFATRAVEWLRKHGPATTVQIQVAFAGEVAHKSVGSLLINRAKSRLGDIRREGRRWVALTEEELKAASAASITRRQTRWLKKNALHAALDTSSASGTKPSHQYSAGAMTSGQSIARKYRGAPEFAMAEPRTFRPDGVWTPPPTPHRRPGSDDYKRIPSRAGDASIPYHVP